MKRLNMQRPPVPLCTVLLAMLVGCTVPLEATNWDVVRDEASAAAEAGDCNAVWRSVWPHAAAGNSEAKLLLASVMYARGLTPPGAGDDVLSRLRSMMSVYSETAKEGNPHSVEVLSAFLQAEVFKEGGGEEHARCLTTNADKAKCVAAAIKSGLFPSFEQWAAEMGAIDRGGEAHCAFKE